MKDAQKKSDVIQTRVTRKKKKQIEQLASERGMSSVDWIRYLIDKEIDAMGSDKNNQQGGS